MATTPLQIGAPRVALGDRSPYRYKLSPPPPPGHGRGLSPVPSRAVNAPVRRDRTTRAIWHAGESPDVQKALVHWAKYRRLDDMSEAVASGVWAVRCHRRAGRLVVHGGDPFMQFPSQAERDEWLAWRPPKPDTEGPLMKRVRLALAAGPRTVSELAAVLSIGKSPEPVRRAVLALEKRGAVRLTVAVSRAWPARRSVTVELIKTEQGAATAAGD